MRLYDQSTLCGNCGNCPAVEAENGGFVLHDPAFPGQGKIRFEDVRQLRERFDTAVATRSLTVTNPAKPDAGNYSFKDHEEMAVFRDNAFSALGVD